MYHYVQKIIFKGPFQNSFSNPMIFQIYEEKPIKVWYTLYIEWMKNTKIIVSYHLHPNISMHILHTVLYTFPKELSIEYLFDNQELL